jgi:hypothetical protein
LENPETHTSEVQRLIVPDVDPTFVILMGLSQAGYLTLKASNTSMNILEILPSVVKPGDDLTIYGKNFGNQGDTVWINGIRLRSADNKIINWTDDKIDLTVPLEIPEGFFDKPQDITVAKGGLTTKKESALKIMKP